MSVEAPLGLLSLFICSIAAERRRMDGWMDMMGFSPQTAGGV